MFQHQTSSFSIFLLNRKNRKKLQIGNTYELELQRPAMSAPVKFYVKRVCTACKPECVSAYVGNWFM